MTPSPDYEAGWRAAIEAAASLCHNFGSHDSMLLADRIRLITLPARQFPKDADWHLEPDEISMGGVTVRVLTPPAREDAKCTCAYDVRTGALYRTYPCCEVHGSAAKPAVCTRCNGSGTRRDEQGNFWPCPSCKGGA